MPKAILDKLDGLDEAMKRLYREGTEDEGLEGKFVLDVEVSGGWALENVQGLKNSLSSARRERDGFKRKLSEFGEDVTPDLVKGLMDEVEELRQGKGKPDESAVEAIKKQLGEKHAKELKDKDEMLSARDREVEQLLIVSEATRFITEHGGNVKLLLPHIVSQCTVDRSSGKPKAVVLQEDGVSARLSMKSGNDNNMEIGEFIESLKSDETFAPAFAGNKATGSGKGDNKDGQRKPSSTSSSRTTTSQQGQPHAEGNIMPDYMQQLSEQRQAAWEAQRSEA